MNSQSDEGCSCVSLAKEFTKILKEWSSVSLNYQKQSEHRLEEAKSLVSDLAAVLGVQSEIVSKVLQNSQNTMQQYSELVINLRKDRDSLRDNLSAALRELEKFSTLTAGLQRIVESAARGGSGVTIGDITARVNHKKQ